MQLPSIVTRLLDASARRRRQLDELRARRPDLEGEYLAAIASDDDAGATRARKARPPSKPASSCSAASASGPRPPHWPRAVMHTTVTCRR
jgi:uncharacterized membrane protein